MKALKLNNYESGIETFVSFAAGYRFFYWILFFSVFLVFMLQHIIYKLCAIHLFVCIR